MVRETRHLWVANLPDNTREDRIREHFQRYGRVQSVKIIISPGTITTVPSSQPSPTGTITSTSELNANVASGQQHPSGDHHLSSTHTSGISKCSLQHHQQPTAVPSTVVGSTHVLEPSIGVNSCNVSNNNVTSSNHNCITMCAATIAFMDIKSASKAHLAEHKFDDRILTTEYYEPSAMHHGSAEVGGGGSASFVINSKMSGDGAANAVGDMKDMSTAHGRFASTSSHGSSDDHSPGRTNFYDRVSTSQSGNRNSEPSTEFIRRNSYHSNDIRGRQRDRHFRNNPYLIVDRSNPISHHRWYETSPSSSSSRNHYNSNTTNSNSVFQQPDSSYDRHNSDLIDTTSPSAVTTSNSNTIKDSKGLLSTQTQALITNSEQPNAVPYKSKLLINNHHHHLKTIKSRSGSESPISGRSSRSHSRSPSSCSSTSSRTTTPTSSHSSPASGGAGEIVTHSTPSSHHHHHHRHIKSNSTGKASTGNSHHQRHRRNLQASLASVPISNSIDKPASTTSSLSSSGSVSGSNPVVHSEDNRPLAICVKNLPLRSSDTSLKDGLFHEYKKHGKVTWVKVVGQSHERYALVCFKKPEDVEKALEVSQDKLFFGCKIEVQPYQGYDVDDNEFRPYEAEIDEYQSKSTRTLFIGNLEKHVTVAELRKAFEVFGEILEIDIKKQGSSPYAFCQYADIVSVVKAVRKMDGEHFGSTRIKLGFGKSMPTTCVWLDGILDGVSEHYLTQQFSRFGAVQKVAIDRDRKTALVSFDQIQCAQQAVKETRGTAIRGRKLQVDYASRECVDAFYARLEKLGVQPANINVESLITPGNNMVRHTFNTSRSRASSFSRPGNPVSGATSPTSTPSAGSTPRHLSSSGSVGKKFRYAAGSPEFYDSNEYLDTYGAGYDQERTAVAGDSDHIIEGETLTITSSSVRRRCDKSPGDIRQVQRVDSESGNSGITSSVRRRCDRSPGEMRILESQRHKILDQLEKCPSSGDETESPKKRAKYSQEMDDAHNNHQNHDSSATNCNGKVLDHRDASSSAAASSYNHNHHRYHHTEMVHRKTVEIRRLSDCNIKHSASVPGGAMNTSVNYTKPNRRPSTDSLSRYQHMDSYQTMMHKRRKTSATASSSSSSSTMTLNESEQHVSKGRGHQLHSNHSFEASGGESEHGSRPGTPLFDEKPDNSIDPRTRPLMAGRPLEPMNLPLPKFAQQFHQQLRQSNQLKPAAHATSAPEPHDINNIASANSQHSSLMNRSISPTPLTPQIRSRSNSLMPPVSSGSSNSETVLTSPRPPSIASNSSDSEQELGAISGPNSSPSLEERLKKFTEDYDSWSSNGRSSSSSHYMNNFRHAVPEIAVPETPELLKSVLKNSMFDEDTKRLENIGDKYVTQAPATLPTATVTSKNAFGTFGGNPIILSGTSSPLMSMMNSIGSSLSLAPIPVHPEALTATSVLSNSLGKLHMPAQQPVTITTMIHQRLGSSGTGSPLNSPNTASPYNSPNPSSASSISSIKGLQYPFPTHPTLSTSALTPSTNTSSVSTATLTAACTSSIASTSTTTTTVTTSSSQKPKTMSSALGKSMSLQEVTPATSSSASATGNNNNSNNFNASCNKSSTNNNNVNNSNAENPPSKLLMKSASLPNCGPSDMMPMESSSLEKIDEKKASTPEPVVVKIEDSKVETVVKKEVETNEKKNHSKDRRKNGENDETPSTPKDDHSKKERDSGFRKDKEAKKYREPEAEKKVDDKKSKSESKNHKKSKDEHHHHSVDEKKEEPAPVERPPSPQRKRRVSFEDVSSVDSGGEQPNHVENNKSHDKISKDSKHHDSSKSNSKHHHHHNHKDKKSSSKEKSHGDDENHAKPKQNDMTCSKDSIFDELKRNSKENIIKTSEKIHKSKKHHHHSYHRENSTKDKENQTQVNNFNDTSSSVMTEDIRSSEDEIIRHLNHNHKKDFSDDHEKRSNHEHHQKNRPESSEESSGKKKYPRRSINASLSTDDSDDSENGNKKTSFFDIPDDAPNISMYDKVKARSCKNLKKQEEEKKIKDKFSALKQSRAKRNKRLNTSDDDSDSDMNDGNSNDMFQIKFRKQRLSGSDDDEKDSDNEILRKAKSRNQFSVCDDESSESGITINDGHRKRNKFSSRKMSRTNVIDSSDDDLPTAIENIEIKQEPAEFQPMATSDFDDLKKHDEPDTVKNHKHSSNGSKKRHHDKNKEDKSGKKSKKLSKDPHRKSSSSADNNQKRDDKMEDIFGPISDDDIKQDVKNNFATALADIKKEPVEEAKEDAAEIASKEQQREESRKRKEKRRREREKQRAIKEEDNSVDLDEAGRALEAQLMSDTEQKINNNEPPKEVVKSDDVFRFTDGDDEMKREHHDGSNKKKKKKKRAKEERKHHHNHHHFDATIKQEVVDSVLESSGAFNNNNNTKIRLDVISNDEKPSVPSLIDDSPQKVVVSSAQVVAPLTPSKKETKAKPDVVIPGFGGVVDETVHQKAVLSIAKELEKKPVKVEAPKVEKALEPTTSDVKVSKVDAEKTEEKSRVVISQEETEDAVAALLGESFSINIDEDYGDPYDDVPIATNDNDTSGSAMIPPEEDEEMKNAIMSLNPDMDHKPETPQSEHDLQIDTDNDETVEEEETTSQPFDNPPKTPDVDISQMEKEKKDVTPEPEVAKPKGEEKKAEKAPVVVAKVEPPKEIPTPSKEETKVEKTPEKKEVPTPIVRPTAPSYLSRFQPPTITIPQDHLPVDRMSPHGTKQASPIIRSSPHLSPVTPLSSEAPNNGQNRITIQTPPTILTPTQKIGPLVMSPNSLAQQPGSPKIIAMPTKADNKTILIHPPGMQHHVRLSSPVPQTPPANIQKTSTLVAPYHLLNKEQSPSNIQVVHKFPPMTPAEKKKLDVKPQQNNVIASLPKPPMAAIQPPHIILQQSAGRPPQIIYPPTASNVIQTTFVKAQEPPKTSVEVKEKSEQWQLNANSVIQKVDASKEEPKLVDKKQPVEVESSHDEEDFEDASPDNSMERESGKKGRGTGRQQRGRKTATVQSPPALEDPAGIQTRRGAKTPASAKRGRGGRQNVPKNTVPPQNVIQTSMPSPAPPPANLNRQQKTSESDVYEFHDDSGEELAKTGDAQRPRLIMTIKSTSVTTPVSTQPITTTPTSTQSIPTVVQTAPITAPVIQPPVVQAVIESSPEPQLLVPPSPNSQQVTSPSHSDDFAQPNNTRKSRRLQEKDGTRTSVDDTIDDVIRNITPSQAQQANNRRATRQTTPVAATPTSMPIHNAAVQQQLQVVTAPLEVKKPARINKKQKDRKMSETSESETDKKPEASVQTSTIVAPPQKQAVIQEPQNVPQPQQIPVAPIQKQPEMMMSQRPTHPKESSELLQLIDPVTGELQKMTQSKEGQYVPVAENRNLGVRQQIPMPLTTSAPPSFTVELKTDDKKTLPPPSVQNVVKISTPVVLEPPKQSVVVPPVEQTHVIKPVITQNPTYTKPPQALKTYVLSAQGIPKSQGATTTPPTPPTTVISTQGVMKINAPQVQHPSTIYNLTNIIPSTGPKYVNQPPQPHPKTIVMPAHQNQSTIMHQSQQQSLHQPQIVHQKIPANGQQPQIVIHSQPHPMMQQQQSGNLMINIPTSSSAGQGISSPRMVKQVIQRSAPSQVPQQISSSAPATTVVMKAGAQHHVIASNQDPKTPTQTYIQQGNKIVQGPPEGAPISYISGGREIIYVGGNVQKQTIYPNYPPNKYVPQQHQAIPSPTQIKPQQIIQQMPSQHQQQSKLVEKVSSQPSVSVTHIQMPPSPHMQQQQQKVYFTNSGQVITNVPPSVTGQQAPDERHQQWMSHEKIPSQQPQPQPLKSRYVIESYDEAHRAQMQSERALQQNAVQSQGQVKRSYVIEGPGAHALPSPSQPVHHAPSSVVNQPIMPPQNKTVIGLNQAPQILTGAVASPPLKAHLTSQQPIVTGASSSRVAIPPISPKDQHHPRHYPPEGYDEAVMQHGDRGAYRSQSPPPAHQTSPLTTRPPYLMTKIYHHQQPSSIYMRGGPEFARLPSRIEPRELADIEEQQRLGVSPPLELRRTTAMPLVSPGDRITDSPMMAPLYLSPRIPQPYFYDGEGLKPLTATEPPPAHRTHAGSIPPTTVYTTQPTVLPPPTNLSHLQRERDHREKEEVGSHQTKDADGNVRYQIVYSTPPAQSLVAPATNSRPIQLTTPPIASQVPLHADTLSRLLERYPLMWQGLLALKTEQAAVQMHFVYGNKKIAKASLPFNSDHTTPPLRIAQRMRLETSQIEGVARKMQITDEHCVLLALPCGFDYGDVLRQTENLQVSFINYLQQKQAAGIINIADPGSQNASYVVHIFPSCEFANESLERIAPDLMYKVANISHLLIVIATV